MPAYSLWNLVPLHHCSPWHMIKLSIYPGWGGWIIHFHQVLDLMSLRHGWHTQLPWLWDIFDVVDGAHDTSFSLWESWLTVQHLLHAPLLPLYVDRVGLMQSLMHTNLLSVLSSVNLRFLLWYICIYSLFCTYFYLLLCCIFSWYWFSCITFIEWDILDTKIVCW